MGVEPNVEDIGADELPPRGFFCFLEVAASVASGLVVASAL
jgi:hypothetical protein